MINKTVKKFYIIGLALVLGVSGCGLGNNKKGGEILTSANDKMDNNPSSQGIINVVDFAGEVLFENYPVSKDSKINHAGKLMAKDTSSWVDIEFLGGEKARLKNGVLDIGFGEVSDATAGLPIGDKSDINPNIRKIKLESGELFVYIRKSEQLKKVRYYFSTEAIYLDVLFGTFAVKVQESTSHIEVCSGQVAVGPSFAMAQEDRPTWPEMQMTSGKKASVSLAGAPKIGEMKNTEMKVLSDTIVSMKGSCDGS